MDYVERPVSSDRLVNVVRESLDRLSLLVPAEPATVEDPSFVLGSNPR